MFMDMPGVAACRTGTAVRVPPDVSPNPCRPARRAWRVDVLV